MDRHVSDAVCAKCEQINLYRDELQGLQRDLERAQLMAREAKAKPRNSMGSDVSCITSDCCECCLCSLLTKCRV